MPARPRLLRRAAVLLVGVLCLLGSDIALPGSSVAPGSLPTTAVAVAGAADPATYDRSVAVRDCALLGRAFVAGSGCARNRCVDGAFLWRRTPGAEACALPGQPRGLGYAATVPAAECRALHRRWIASVNYCASQPDRSLAVVRDAPQCTRPATVYVTLAERAGAYDVCVTPARAAALTSRQLVREQRTRAAGGVLVVGDSVSWRGGDELAGLYPGMVVDGEPGRRPSELAARLDAYRATHGRLTGLVVELGTNTAPGYGRRDLAATLRTVAPATPVMLVLPYVRGGAGNSASARRFGSWMRSLAAYRDHACVADWPAYVRANPGLLQDGIHTRNDAEGEWAHWLSAQWARCT